jgi:quinol monooxygenase YgiN
MSTSVLVTIAGVLVAAVGTGLLTGRCVRRPRISLIAWTVGMSAITVALLAQGIGYATGFEAWTFRVIQLSAQLVAPLLLAWGLVEQVARGAAVRFGARLATAAVAAVAGVVLATDPLASVAFTKAWPSASTHYQIIPHYALTLVALVAGVTVLAALAVCAARGRRVPADGPLVIGAAAVAVATLLLIALRFTLPSPAYPALCAIAAVVVWVGLSRVGDRALGSVQADRAGNAGAAGLDRAAARAEVASEAEGTDGVKRSRFKGDRGSRGGDDRGSRRGDDRQSREADDRGARGGDDRRARRADDGLRDPLARPPAADDFGAPDFPPVGQASDWRDDPRDWPGRDRPGPDRPSSGRPNPDRPSPDRPSPDRLGRDRHGPGPQGDRPRYQPDLPGSEPATGMFDASLPMLGDLPLPASLTTPQAQPGTDLAVPVTPPHGLIAIYTLLEDKVADFDRAADEVAEQVRAGEPDTLVYVIHTVPKAPMQRIFYEVYRDRAAYEQHEKQPYVQRFVAARRPYVLATNVIELRLKYAKVSPLPQAEAQAAQAQAAQSQAAQTQAQRPASAPNLPAVRNGNGGRPGGSRPNGSRPSDGRQDAPDYPRRDPGYQPRDPGYQREPSYQPHQPSYQPAEPSYQPSGSGYQPRDPGSQPRDPGQPRREPSFQPADASYQPRDPGYYPRDPGYQAADPGYQPRDPGFYPRDPGDPGYPPREPRYTPRQQDDYPPYPSRDREYPSGDREYPSRGHGYPPPAPEYPSRGRGTEWSRGPRDPYAEPGDPYREPGDRYPQPRDQRDPRDQRNPREQRDPREPRDPRDPYDPPATPRYDRI